MPRVSVMGIYGMSSTNDRIREKHTASHGMLRLCCDCALKHKCLLRAPGWPCGRQGQSPQLKNLCCEHGWQRLKWYNLSNELICDYSTINTEPIPCICSFFNFIPVPARRRPGTSLTLPTISPSQYLSALASVAG